MGTDGSAGPLEPSSRDAAVVATDVLGAPVAEVARFATGLAHFVYDVRMADGRCVVVRLSRREDVDAARGALYWSSSLRPKGVPLPAVLHDDLSLMRYAFPVVVLERLPGNDLGIVYSRLGQQELLRLAERLASIQTIVASLPAGGGYGYARSYEGEFPYATWSGMIAASCARSRARIRAGGIVDEAVVNPVAAAAERFSHYFARIAPVPFLHDITTKNVIVHAGRLSGIVDVDDLCFGDPLLLVALIRVALYARDLDPVYFDYWRAIARPDAAQTAAIDFYTALYCLDFLGEAGQRFNRAVPAPVDPAYLARLRELLVRACKRLA